MRGFLHLYAAVDRSSQLVPMLRSLVMVWQLILRSFCVDINSSLLQKR